MTPLAMSAASSRPGCGVAQRRHVERVGGAVRLADEAGLAVVLPRDDRRAAGHEVEDVHRARLDAQVAARAAVVADDLDHAVTPSGSSEPFSLADWRRGASRAASSASSGCGEQAGAAAGCEEAARRDLTGREAEGVDRRGQARRGGRRRGGRDGVERAPGDPPAALHDPAQDRRRRPRRQLWRARSNDTTPGSSTSMSAPGTGPHTCRPHALAPVSRSGPQTSGSPTPADVRPGSSTSRITPRPGLLRNLLDLTGGVGRQPRVAISRASPASPGPSSAVASVAGTGDLELHESVRGRGGADRCDERVPRRGALAVAVGAPASGIQARRQATRGRCRPRPTGAVGRTGGRTRGGRDGPRPRDRRGAGSPTPVGGD